MITARLAGEPLVFVHGWPLSSLTWRKVVPPLAEIYRCIALDLLGAGESAAEASQALGIGAQGRILGSFLDALGLERSALVGHDSGGSVVRSFAVAHPERISRLVLADTEVPGHRPAFVGLFQLAARLPGADRLLGRTLGSRSLSRLPFGSCFAELRSFDFDEFHAKVVSPNARTDVTRAACRKFLLDFDLAEVDEAGALYGRLTMPKCVIWGEDDRFFPLAQGRRLAGMLPEPTRFEVIPRAGLLVHEERPEAWLRTVRDFLTAA
ncbi:MAG TPA: alpha/beta hydrolase [Myxococcota bacterium]|nr:alpha/beta hydrolase [Myxococcota bacterium]